MNNHEVSMPVLPNSVMRHSLKRSHTANARPKLPFGGDQCPSLEVERTSLGGTTKTVVVESRLDNCRSQHTRCAAGAVRTHEAQYRECALAKASFERPPQPNTSSKTFDDQKDWSSTDGDTATPILIFVVACLTLAVLLLRSPDTVVLTADQISLMLSWGSQRI